MVVEAVIDSVENRNTGMKELQGKRSFHVDTTLILYFVFYSSYNSNLRLNEAQEVKILMIEWSKIKFNWVCVVVAIYKLDFI